MPLSAEDQAAITYFFRYFRRHASAVDCLGKHEFLATQHVVVGATLDALAGHWGRSFSRPPKEPGRVRMGAFLSAYGDKELFSRVSRPDALRRAVAVDKPVSPNQQDALRREMPSLSLGRIRRASDDPTFDDLASRLAGTGIAPDWLAQSTYGQLLYRLHRCGWVHEGAAVAQLGNEPSDTSPDAIGYENYNSKPRLVVPIAFMRRTLETVIDGFERDCTARGVIPSRD